jgi:periplasmic divalent cation tolerance protein
VSEYVVISCATGSRENADAIATALVEQRFAACVQIVPIESVYRWHGSVQRDAEHLLHIKTTARRIADVERAIAALHPYDVPEITVVGLTGGSAAYLAWIDESVVDGEGGAVVEFRGYVRDH